LDENHVVVVVVKCCGIHDVCSCHIIRHEIKFCCL